MNVMPRKPSTGTSVAAVVLLVVVLVAASAFLYGWLVMVGLGITHHEFGWPATTIRYWPSVGIGAVLSLLTGGTRVSTR